MPRASISTDYRNSIEDRHGAGDIDLIFVTLSHADLAEPVRVVNDSAQPNGVPIEYDYNGVRFIGLPFRLTYLSDDDNPPRGQIEIANVEREISEVVRLLTESPRVKLELIRGLAFTRQQAPNDHVWAGAGVVPEIVADHLRLQSVRVDAIAVSADIVAWNFTKEPYGIRATKGRFPGLFR